MELFYKIWIFDQPRNNYLVRRASLVFEEQEKIILNQLSCSNFLNKLFLMYVKNTFMYWDLIKYF